MDAWNYISAKSNKIIWSETVDTWTLAYRVANAHQSKHVICDQNTSNLESDGWQNSTQTAITATATKVANTEHYYSNPIDYAQKQEPKEFWN